MDKYDALKLEHQCKNGEVLAGVFCVAEEVDESDAGVYTQTSECCAKAEPTHYIKLADYDR